MAAIGPIVSIAWQKRAEIATGGIAFEMGSKDLPDSSLALADDLR
jgi:hypothetical protein